MMKYYIEARSTHHTTKNNLQRDARELLKDYDGTLCSNEDNLEVTIRDFKLGMELLEKKHKRCNPLRVSDTKAYSSEARRVYSLSVFELRILEVKREV
jgi:hypothetical protein